MYEPVKSSLAATLIAALLICFGALIAGCGGSSPEEKANKAEQELNQNLEQLRQSAIGVRKAKAAAAAADRRVCELARQEPSPAIAQAKYDAARRANGLPPVPLNCP